MERERERDTRLVRDKTQVNPEPVRPDLFAFLERLFDGDDQKPEMIEVRQAYGQGARSYGTTVCRKEFKPGEVKPTRERLVALSNEFLHDAQNNCNELGKAHRYGVLAKHFAKSDTYYEVWLIALQPKQRNGYDGLHDDLPDDENGQEDAHRNSMLRHALEHVKQADVNDQWRQEQFATSIGSIIQMLMDDRREDRQLIISMQRESRENFRALEDALSSKQQRELAAKEQDFKLALYQHGFEFFKQMFPVVVNQITGKKTIPTDKTNESIAFDSFLDGLTDKQAMTLFGEWDAEKKELKPTGIFTPTQAGIFFGIAKCTLPVSDLDKLLEGEFAITEEQTSKVPSVISSDQFMPLVALIMGRKKKQLDSKENASS